MEPANSRTTPLEVEEDIILRRIFLVSLTGAEEKDSGVVYLESIAAEILSEGKELRLLRDLMERVVINRLSENFPSAESPFQYLISCYQRAHDEGGNIANLKDDNLKHEMELAVRQAKRVCVSYCRIYLKNPELFPSGNTSASKWHYSPLLPLIFSEVGSIIDGYGRSGSAVQSPPGFLNDFFMDSDFDYLNQIFIELYEQLRCSVVKVSALGNFQNSLRALLYLVRFPIGAKSLVNHSWWIPKNIYMNGRAFEMTSILGPFFGISALLDHKYFQSHPDVG